MTGEIRDGLYELLNELLTKNHRIVGRLGKSHVSRGLRSRDGKMAESAALKRAGVTIV